MGTNTKDREVQVNLSNDLMFHLVMQNEERCRKLLEMILGFPISKVVVTAQKDITPDLFQKAIRLDVFAEDAEHTRYDVEMQTTQMKDLGMRLRYYQARLDADGLRRGEKYGKLAKSFIIFICMDDPYNKGLSRYTIEPACKETDIPVKSGMQWIVLNASGDGSGVTKEVQEFLAYAKDSCPENAANAFLREIGSAMERILTGEWRDAMITYEEKMQWMREDLLEEGREKGRAEGRAEGREEGLKEALQASRKTARNLYDRGMSVDDIADAMTINADIVQSWINGEA